MSLIFYLPICLIFSMGFLFPVVSLFVSGFKGFNLAFFSDPFFEHVVTFTYGQALVSSLLSVFLGLVVAFLIQEWKVVGGRFLWRFCLLCSSLPSIIVALGILGAWGPGSILGRIVFDQRTVFGWPGLLLGHVFLNFSIPMRLIGNALRERNRTSELTALSIGMNRWSVFWKITLPEVRTSVLSSWILTFLFCSTSLFIVLFLGGGPRFTTLEVSLYEAVKLNFDNGKAVQIASLQALVGIGLYVVYLKAQRPPRIKSPNLVPSIFVPRSFSSSMLGTVSLWVLIGALIGVPLVSILQDGGFLFSFLDSSELWSAAVISLGIAGAVGLIAIVILYPLLHVLHHSQRSGRKQALLWLVVLPQFFSSLVISLAISIFYPGVRGTEMMAYLGIVLAQTLFVIPLIQFPLREGFYHYSLEREWTAQSLGASRWQRFLHVELPIMRRPLFLAVLITVGYSLGEVSTILLFSPMGIRTLALGIFQSMSRYRFQEAHAITVILLLVMLIVFGVAGFLEDSDE